MYASLFVWLPLNIVESATLFRYVNTITFWGSNGEKERERNKYPMNTRERERERALSNEYKIRGMSIKAKRNKCSVYSSVKLVDDFSVTNVLMLPSLFL